MSFRASLTGPCPLKCQFTNIHSLLAKLILSLWRPFVQKAQFKKEKFSSGERAARALQLLWTKVHMKIEYTHTLLTTKWSICKDK